MTSLATPAWWMAGRLRNVPGVLAAGGGRLAFLTEDGPVFSEPMIEIGQVVWPWHWFGGGCRIWVGGQRYNITFVRPNGAPDVHSTLLTSGMELAAAVVGVSHPDAVRGLVDVRDGRSAGKAWKEALPS